MRRVLGLHSESLTQVVPDVGPQLPVDGGVQSGGRPVDVVQAEGRHDRNDL